MPDAKPSPVGGLQSEPRSPRWLESMRLRFRTYAERARQRWHSTSTAGRNAHSRTRRKWPWIVAAVLLLAAYPVLGTLALRTGLAERMLRSEDLKVEIGNPSYTFWPGLVHVKHVHILVNGETQFSLAADELVVKIRLLELFKHRVHVTKLAAENVHYQMRVQVESTKGIEKRVAAYPPLPGLPGKNVVHRETAKKTEKDDATYTVQVEGLDVQIQELWFFEYRYLGEGRLRGGFTVGPHVMEVRTAVQDIGPGDVRFGAEETVARNLRGQVTANIPRVDPEKHADASFMELVSARVNLRSDVVSLVNVGAYADNLEVSRGAGPLVLDLYLEKGWLGTKSHLDFDTSSLRVKGNGFGVETDWHLAFDAAGKIEGAPGKDEKAVGQEKKPADAAASEVTSTSVLPLMRSSSNSTYVSLARRDRAFTIQVHGHREEASLDRIRLSGATKIKHASVRMPNIVSVDLRDLDVLFPADSAINVQGGKAQGSLKLDMDEEYWLRGPFHMSIQAIELDAAGVEVRGNANMKTRVEINPKQKRERFEDFAFSLRDVGMHAGSKEVNSWWMDLTGGRLLMSEAAGSPHTEGSVSIRAKDLEPILQALAQKGVITKLIPMFVSLGDFRARTSMRQAGPLTDAVIESESDVWDISGRVFKNGKKTQLAVVVGGQAVSLGVADGPDGLEIMPFAKTGWLNEHLREFPKPLVQMRPSKP
jgi:hypothetical protein